MNRMWIVSLFGLSAALCAATPASAFDVTAEWVSPKIESIPPWFLHRDDPANKAGDQRTIVGRYKATTERAKQDVREELDRAVQSWLLEAGVPRSWSAPKPLVEGLVQDRYVATEVKPYAQVYLGGLRVDFSPVRRDQIVREYERELVGHRLGLLSGGIAFLLACLAGVAGYIRADEATRGYYTNRLRLISAVGVGAAGMAIYKMLT